MLNSPVRDFIINNIPLACIRQTASIQAKPGSNSQLKRVLRIKSNKKAFFGFYETSEMLKTEPTLNPGAKGGTKIRKGKKCKRIKGSAPVVTIVAQKPATTFNRAWEKK